MFQLDQWRLIAHGKPVNGTCQSAKDADDEEHQEDIRHAQVLHRNHRFLRWFNLCQRCRQAITPETWKNNK